MIEVPAGTMTRDEPGRVTGRLLVVGFWLLAATANVGLLVVGSWLLAATAASRSHRLLLAFLLLCGGAVALAANNQQPTTNNRSDQQPTSSNQPADLLDSVAARIMTASVLHGDFAQQRTLAGFAKPLRSSGNFIAARERGVLWTSTAPFPVELVITDEQIRERVDGQDTVVLDAGSEPALRQINRVLLTLLQGDVAALREHFAVAGSIDAAHWRLDLTPLGQLGEAIARIQLTGSTHVESVVIDERNGDASRIDFSALRAADALSAAEISRFD